MFRFGNADEKGVEVTDVTGKRKSTRKEKS